MRPIGASILAALTLTAACVAAGCGPDDGDAPDAAGETADTPEALPGGRTFLLAGRAEAYDHTALRKRVVSLDPLGTDLVEAVVVPLDVYGIPWEDFTTGGANPQTLPGAWISALQAAVDTAAATGLPLALALSPVSADFDSLAPNVTEDLAGNLDFKTPWPTTGYCYDPAKDGNPDKWRQAYGRYAAWVASRFQPRFLIVGQRINLYDGRCASDAADPYPAVAAFLTEAHQQVKALESPPVTIATVDVEDLYGLPAKPKRCVGLEPKACLAQRAPLLEAFEADRLGLESYPAPFLARLGGAPPDDWLAAVADARPGLRPVIAGTGFPAVSMRTAKGACVPLVETTEELQRAWLDQVFAVATDREMDLVVWSSPVDLLPADVVASCPCAGDASLCQHFSQLGAKADDIRLRMALGLVAQDGTERMAAALWRQLLE